MRFCPWYALQDSDRDAPASPGVLQLRVSEGLLDYPTGKSAMVWYQLAQDVRAAAGQLAVEHAAQLAALRCRHTVEMTAADVAGLPEFFARLVHDFRARFGATPRFAP